MAGQVDQVLLHANQFLEMMAEVTIAHLLLEAALIAEHEREAAHDEESQEEYDFYIGKVMAAKFFVANVLPGVHAKLTAVQSKRPLGARHPRRRLLRRGLIPACGPGRARGPLRPGHAARRRGRKSCSNSRRRLLWQATPRRPV